MIKIEWHSAKAASNFQKHGIDFEDAKNIFLDASRLERADPRDYGKEVRLQVIGMVEGEVLFVVYTERSDAYRMISARKANQDERTRYYQSHP